VEADVMTPFAGGQPAIEGVRADSEERFLNREVSWCDFADRLLDLMADKEVPLLERVKFAAICATGMDEFFQVRVAGLKDQVAAGLRRLSPDGKTPSQQLKLIRQRCLELAARQDNLFNDVIVPELDRAGVGLVSWQELNSQERTDLLELFDREIFPVLTPLAVDPGHPFPYISNLSLNLGVVVADQLSGEHRFARVKIPPLFPRFVQVGDMSRFILLEDLIGEHIDRLFPQMSLGGHYFFRVTRNADLSLEEGEADDLLAAVEVELRRRRFGRAVRLEVAKGMPESVRDLLVEELELTADDVYEIASPIDLTQLWQLHAIDRPDLHDPPWVPMTPPRLATAGDEPVDLFAAIKERDILVQHPYDSFANSVEAFVNQAADDPRVLAIKQTLYRTSHDTEIVDALVRAAEKGKQVAALVELKARFDEQANISWARQLEQAGVHVVYGLVGLKTHSKTALVIRREEDGVRGYCHIGTGNYNSGTARVYEDLGLLSADPALCADLTELFNFLTGYGRQSRHRRIITAPHELRTWVLQELAQEAASEDGRATIKVNGLTDPEVIDALYDASCAGVRIDLVVRGLCRLRPGVPGLSEHITVRSVVGRFLEHSRIYRFGEPGSSRGARHFIGSADLMERNLDRRVECIAPVLLPELAARLDEILDLSLADDTNSWVLRPDGSWERVEPVEHLSTQLRLQEMALERARRRRAADVSP
jgi:polyphosphate kinase